ncbi:hypothetical protein O7632_26110 [Solwaraspora sp. WMMD406]|uniref:hypothetical protein n=1 Tax=Solwaraspora sp. WMMD406 TaxID=3016095 RepID=UPI0024176040|nr:hypothetical protein [Solwaraspora sp. WMMD406]MDG4767538.1 hypothetical protein [Solwaraspora sp. WMMD406]
MRGDLDDALARLARRDQLQRRVNQGNDRTSSAAQEIAAVVRQVVERHPGLLATVRLENGGQAVELRIANQDGHIQLTVTGPAGPGALPSATRHVTTDGSAIGHGVPNGSGAIGHGVAGHGVADGGAALGMPTAGGPPEWPPRTENTPDSPAARLAELIRQDPSLLNGAADG